MLLNIIDQVGDLRLSTTPLFKVESGIPIIQGTCSFIKYKSQYFILTAQHVFENLEDNLYINLEYNSKSLIKPGGQSYSDKKNDIGIIILDDETKTLLQKRYKFIDFSSHTQNDNIDLFKNYSFLGFPESKGRFNKYKGKIKIEPFVFTTEIVNDEVLVRHNINVEDKICVYYEKNKVHNVLKDQITNGPDVYGISGCLLIHHIKDKFIIVGILTDWFIENKKILIGIRSKFIEEILSYAESKNPR